MASLMWQRRDLAQDAAGVKNTFSSWDSCMSKTYCKWPVIAVIIFGSLIALSLIWCLARCLCCGLECCCGCFACCNACCPSPRGRKSNNGYQQPPPMQPYQQYHSAQPPFYAAQGGYRGAQTATFDAPTKNGARTVFNADALPPMPSWDNATSRKVQDDDVELEKLDYQAQDSLLQNGTPAQYQGHQQYAPSFTSSARPYETSPQPSPYQNYEHDQFSPNPNHVTSPVSTHAPSYHTYAPATSPYEHNQSMPQPNRAMSPVSSYAPSYHTYAPFPSTYAPAPSYIERKPVNGTWRDV